MSAMDEGYLEQVRRHSHEDGITFKEAQRRITLRRAKLAYDMKWRKMPGATIASLMGISRTSVTRLINRWQAHLDEQ